MKGYCKECDFFDRTGSYGWCRRYAPKPRLVKDEDTANPVTYWAEYPSVADDDWCGEFVENSPA